MKWSLNELRRVGGEPLRFDETVDLTARLKERRPDLIDAGEVHVHGIFTNDRFGIVDYCQVETVLTLPSTRSFTPVKLKLKFDFSEHYLDKYQKKEIDDFDDTDAVVIVLDKDYIDLTKAVVDNILVLGLPNLTLVRVGKSKWKVRLIKRKQVRRRLIQG